MYCPVTTETQTWQARDHTQLAWLWLRKAQVFIKNLWVRERWKISLAQETTRATDIEPELNTGCARPCEIKLEGKEEAAKAPHKSQAEVSARRNIS